MSSEERYKKLCKDVAEAERRSAQAEGAMKSVLKELEDKFGCKDIDAARSLVQTKTKELSRMEEELDDKLDEYERVWKGLEQNLQ